MFISISNIDSNTAEEFKVWDCGPLRNFCDIEGGQTLDHYHFHNYLQNNCFHGLLGGGCWRGKLGEIINQVMIVFFF
jgi:hypothetical protein